MKTISKSTSHSEDNENNCPGGGGGGGNCPEGEYPGG